MGEIVDYGKKIIHEVPLEGMLWFAGGSLTKVWLVYYFKVLLFHLLPAIFVDLMLRITGNKP
ncbi:jg22105, partial [Pararge aegeria aegeria]